MSCASGFKFFYLKIITVTTSWENKAITYSCAPAILVVTYWKMDHELNNCVFLDQLHVILTLSELINEILGELSVSSHSLMHEHDLEKNPLPSHKPAYAPQGAQSDSPISLLQSVLSYAVRRSRPVVEMWGRRGGS
jgi:hypothetical protein